MVLIKTRTMAVAMACLLTACTASIGGRARHAPVPFDVVLAGRHSGVYSHYFTVIRNSRTFATIWKRATARQYPAPAPPRIDFSRYTVIAVFLGETRTGGYHIKITDVARNRAGLTVTVRERHPGAGCNTTQALTEPFEIVKTPVTAEPVRFIKSAVSQPCD